MIDTLPEELRGHIIAGESINVEFKKSTTDITKDVYDTICSFSNRDGGHIFLGVKDNGKIVGVDRDSIAKMKKDFVNAVNNPNKMNPPLYLSLAEFEVDGCIILYCYVPVGTTVYRHAGRIYDRNNESDIDITENADLVFHLYARKQESFFVNKVYPVFSVTDLRHDLIERARMMTEPGHLWRSLDDEELLRSAKLILNDREKGKDGLTLAAILLFGSDQLIYSVLPQHKTDALLRVYDTDRYDDRDMIETNLLDSYDRLMAFGKKHLNDLFVLDGDKRVSARNRILREVIGNLLCHRDFSSGYIASMVIYKDKLVTKNGNVAHGFGWLKLDTFKPFAKNPVIADVFRNIGWADELGSGMRNAYKYTKLYSGGEPEFEEGDMFVCTVPLNNAATGVKMGPSFVTSDEAGDEDSDEDSDEAKLLNYCSEPRSKAEIMEYLGIKSERYIRQKLMIPLLEKGELLRTIPDKPSSPKQRYIRKT